MKPISHKLQRHGQIPLRFRPHEYKSKRGKVTAREGDECGWKKTERKEREEWRTKTERMKSSAAGEKGWRVHTPLLQPSSWNRLPSKSPRPPAKKCPGSRASKLPPLRPQAFFSTALNFSTSSACFQSVVNCSKTTWRAVSSSDILLWDITMMVASLQRILVIKLSQTFSLLEHLYWKI